MTTRQQIVDAARSLLDVPFRHQGRLPSAGIDCVGLLTCVGDTIGYPYTDWRDYDQPDGTLLDRLSCNLRQRPDLMFSSGDVLAFKIGKKVRHVGIATPVGMLHTYQTVGKVVEHTLDVAWRARIVAVFEFPEVW